MLIGAGLMVIVCLWMAAASWWDAKRLERVLARSEQSALTLRIENATLRQSLAEQESHVRAWMDAAKASEKLAKEMDLVALEKARQLREVEGRYRTLPPTPGPDDRARVLDPIILDLTKGWGPR